MKMTMEKALKIVTEMGYEARQNNLDYIAGIKDGKLQWFKIKNGKLLKRVDAHPSFMKWEETVMKIYHTETQADYDSLMVELEEQGAKWSSGTNPTEANHWSEFETQTSIKVQDCILTYHGVEYFERANPETPIIKYTAKKETQLPEWANWLARDKDGDLCAYTTIPTKGSIFSEWFTRTDGYEKVEETDDTFKHIKWTDEEPTQIKRGLETGGVSVEELNSITNAKAHGYDEIPIVADIINEGVYVVKDGDEIAVGETTSISFEEAMGLVENKVETDTTHTNTNKDMVNKPNHYIGEYGLEVEDVLRNFIPRYTDPYVGHRIASAIEYLLRSPLKNRRQDIEKAGKNIQQALAYLDMTDELK
jgi:hypothetical protein